MLTTFSRIAVGTKFRLHRKTGHVAVKTSTNTAHFFIHDKIYPVESRECIWLESNNLNNRNTTFWIRGKRRNK